MSNPSGSVSRESALALIEDANHWSKAYAEARDQLRSLEEQYEDQREFCRKADLDAREAEAERDRLKEQLETQKSYLLEREAFWFTKATQSEGRYQALHEAAQRVVEREASGQPQEWAMVALARVVSNPAKRPT
jgi:hypothetical protein